LGWRGERSTCNQWKTANGDTPWETKSSPVSDNKRDVGKKKKEPGGGGGKKSTKRRQKKDQKLSKNKGTAYTEVAQW